MGDQLVLSELICAIIQDDLENARTMGLWVLGIQWPVYSLRP